MPIPDSRSLTRSTKTATVHKVIDITPQPATPSQQASAVQLLAIADRYRNQLFALGAVLFAAVVALLAVPHRGHTAVSSSPAVATAAVAAQPVVVIAQKTAASQAPILIELNLPTAVQQGLVECQWRGNGKDRLFMDARNMSAQPLRLHLGAGQLLASTDSTIVVLKSQQLDFGAHALLHEEFPTVATSSANRVVGAKYHLSDGALPDLDKLFSYVAEHPGARAEAVQTAALILTENLPLSAFAKFNELSAGKGNMAESQDFKADTGDILSALMIVKEIGISRPLAVTIDPQLEIEGMIDPDAHGLAAQYYGISDEWGYWKTQLLQGDPSTRHYALFGIARYYPDIALQMLPKWARGEGVNGVFRVSAVEALAETNRAEAIPILRELEREFGSGTDLGRAAHQGANYLDAQFAHASSPTDLQARRQGALASTGN